MTSLVLFLICQTIVSYCSPLSLKLYVDRLHDGKVKVNCSFQLNHHSDVANITINNFDTSTYILTYDTKIMDFSKRISSNITSIAYEKNKFLCFDYESYGCNVPAMSCALFINETSPYPDTEPYVASLVEVQRYNQLAKSKILVDGLWNPTLLKVAFNSTSQIKNVTCSFEDICPIEDIILSVYPSIHMSTNRSDFLIYKNSNNHTIKAVKSNLLTFNDTGRYEVFCKAKTNDNITYTFKKEILVYRTHESNSYKSYFIGAIICAIALTIAIVVWKLRDIFMKKVTNALLTPDFI